MDSLYNITSDFNWSPTDLPQKARILVEDTCFLNSSFLIHHFLMMGMKANVEIYLIGIEDTYEHYNSVLKKNGMSMEKYMESGLLHYYAFKQSNDNINATLHQMKSYSDFSTSLLKDLKAEENKQKTIFVIIDEITLFCKNIMNTLKEVSTVLEAYENYALIYRYHRDLYTEQALNVNTMISRFSDNILSLLPLETGHSTTAHAQLLFKVNKIQGPSVPPIKRLVRIMESSIKVIAYDDV